MAIFVHESHRWLPDLPSRPKTVPNQDFTSSLHSFRQIFYPQNTCGSSQAEKFRRPVSGSTDFWRHYSSLQMITGSWVSIKSNHTPTSSTVQCRSYPFPLHPRTFVLPCTPPLFRTYDSQATRVRISNPVQAMDFFPAVHALRPAGIVYRILLSSHCAPNMDSYHGSISTQQHLQRTRIYPILRHWAKDFTRMHVYYDLFSCVLYK